MTDRAIKIQCMRFLFARPSSIHDDESQPIKWGDDGLPKIFRGRAEAITSDDELLVSLYDELIAREARLGSSAS